MLGYFPDSLLEELAEGLVPIGAAPEAARQLRERLAVRYDIDVLGPPRQAGDEDR